MKVAKTTATLAFLIQNLSEAKHAKHHAKHHVKKHHSHKHHNADDDGEKPHGHNKVQIMKDDPTLDTLAEQIKNVQQSGQAIE